MDSHLILKHCILLLHVELRVRVPVRAECLRR